MLYLYQALSCFNIISTVSLLVLVTNTRMKLYIYIYIYMYIYIYREREREFKVYARCCKPVFLFLRKKLVTIYQTLKNEILKKNEVEFFEVGLFCHVNVK